jgi:hypothetical protein
MTPERSLVKIVRVANEGFNTKPYRSSVYYHTGTFWDVLITDLNQKNITVDEYSHVEKSGDLLGCFCFFHKYDLWQLSDRGNLFIRKGHRVNIGYLPKDENVFVRNITADLKRLYVNRKRRVVTNPENNEPHEFIFDISLNSGKFDWVKMPLWLAIERTEVHLKFNMYEDELISEVYLTKDQVDKLVKKRKIEHIQDHLIAKIASSSLDSWLNPKLKRKNMSF